MNFTVINDCKDANAVGRQMSRTSSLLGGNGVFVGVSSDLEASGNLIDVLDAYGDEEGIILVNVAPRNGSSKKWGNGTPFGYFRHKRVLVVSSIEGLTLSLVKKFGLTETIHVMDISTVAEQLVQEHFFSPELGKYIGQTQFRSYDFLPRIAGYLMKKKDVIATPTPIAEIFDAPTAVWWVDNFGNCKTTLVTQDLVSKEDRVTIGERPIPYVQHLKDVPDKTLALVTGSSGIYTKRFIEIVAQGERASDILALSSGSPVAVQ